MMSPRTGAALLEVLVSAVLASVVMSSAALLLHTQSRIAHRMLERSERTDAARSALLTLGQEWRTLMPRADVYATGMDSVSTRIFRGVAVVCRQAPGASVVRYRGLRVPDAAKDSALQVATGTVASFHAVAPDSACAHAAGELVLALDSLVAPAGTMWLLFESGGYHLSSQALRYARAGESRQPITNQLFDDRRSAFSTVADSVTRAFGVTLADQRSATTLTAHIALLNSR